MEFVFITGKKVSTKDVEIACAALSLQLTMKGSLKLLPPNIHWHYKMPKQTGVLEITLMTNENKLILSCKKNRIGEWISEASASLKLALER
jgi:hypothetical protein